MHGVVGMELEMSTMTQVKTALTDACKEAFGFKTKRHQDWFNEMTKRSI